VDQEVGADALAAVRRLAGVRDARALWLG
jgi:hypothetical protein